MTMESTQREYFRNRQPQAYAAQAAGSAISAGNTASDDFKRKTDKDDAIKLAEWHATN